MVLRAPPLVSRRARGEAAPRRSETPTPSLGAPARPHRLDLTRLRVRPPEGDAEPEAAEPEEGPGPEATSATEPAVSPAPPSRQANLPSAPPPVRAPVGGGPERRPRAQAAARVEAEAEAPGGRPLPKVWAERFQRWFGASGEGIRLREGAGWLAEAGAGAASLGAQIWLRGRLADTPAPRLVHELTHVAARARSSASQDGLPDQEAAAERDARAAAGAMLRGAPPAPPAPDPGRGVRFDDDDPYALVPDEEKFDTGVDAKAATKNETWWTRLGLDEITPHRELDPKNHPHAFANRVRKTQVALRDAGIKAVANAPLTTEGVLGPRTYLALVAVANKSDHPARTAVQTLGWDLSALASAPDVAASAEALALRPKVLLEGQTKVLGADAVRLYSITAGFRTRHDVDVLDEWLFGPEGPRPTLRDQDRQNAMDVLLGAEKLTGYYAVLQAERGDLHQRIDPTWLAERRQLQPGTSWLQFIGTLRPNVRLILDRLGIEPAMTKEAERLPPAQRKELYTAMRGIHRDLLAATGRRSVTGLMVLVRLPELPAAQRRSVALAQVAAREQHEAEERARVDAHNAALVIKLADHVIKTLGSDNRTKRRIDYGPVLSAFNRNPKAFELLLDELERRGRLNDWLDDLKSLEWHEWDVLDLASQGRWASEARIVALRKRLQAQRKSNLRHTYLPDEAVVVLSTGERLKVGEVAGDKNSLWLRDEDREQLKPGAQKRFNDALKPALVEFMDALLAPDKPASFTEKDMVETVTQDAWKAAKLSKDDIEEVVWEESVKFRGLRRAPPQADGVERYEVDFVRVQRIRKRSEWEEVGAAAWRSDFDFDTVLFWFSQSQIADAIQAIFIAVTIAAVLIVAWEAGVIAAMVEAAGGWAAVGLSVGISVGFYMLTHKTWTWEGLLLAGIQGYLFALGFKIFMPVGTGVGNLVLSGAARPTAAAIAEAVEQASLRRLVAAWIARHATTGALVGGATTPATMFCEDLLGSALHSRGFRSFGAYVKGAGWGLLLGAVFELGGSAVLQPLLGGAGRSALTSLAEAVGKVRAANLTFEVFTAEMSRVTSGFGRWLRLTVEDVAVQGIEQAVAKRLAVFAETYLEGARLALYRQALELGGLELTAKAVDSLQRVLRLSTLGDDALAKLLATARTGASAGGAWLEFMAGLDDAALKALLAKDAARHLAAAPSVLQLRALRTPAELLAIADAHFAGAVPDMEAFALLIQGTPTEGRIVELLATRGQAVSPNTLRALSAATNGLEEDVVAGLGRAFREAGTRAHVEAMLLAAEAEAAASFLRALRTASPAEVTAFKTAVTDGVAGGRLISALADQALPFVSATADVQAVLLGLQHIGPDEAALIVAAVRAAPTAGRADLLQALGRAAGYAHQLLPAAGRAQTVATLTRIATNPRIQGLGDWVRFSTAQRVGASPADQARNFGDDLGELLVAENVARGLSPGGRVRVGNDANALKHPTTGNTLRSYDLVVTDGGVQRNVDVYSPTGAQPDVGDLGQAINHAADKIISDPTLPATFHTQGRIEGAVRLGWPPTDNKVKAGTITTAQNGDVRLLTPNGMTIDRGNFFDDYVGTLNNARRRPAGAARVDQLSVYDRAGKLLYIYRRDATTGLWSGGAP